MDYGQELRFGSFLTPSAADAGHVVELARICEDAGLDLVTVQDHPYQRRFLDAWTLLSVIAASTSRIRVAPNVANLPLRPPFVLATAAASLDLLSGGRVELGLGAGSFWDAIEASGGPRRTPGEAVDALTEAIEVIRATWGPEGETIRHEGTHYRVRGVKAGPAPAHPIEIWLGAYRPRMLRLIGRTADGWLPSQGYHGPEELRELHAVIDDAASAAGRDPAAVRRLYNIHGEFGTGSAFLQGQPRDWASQLAELTLAQGVSTYVLSSDDPATLQTFGAEVAPAVREQVAAARGR